MWRGAASMSPTPDSNTGDGIRMAEAAGARFEAGYPNAAAWMPVSQVPLGKGRTGVFPHLVDRYKPGVIAVNGKGRRFTNEANSYHDVGAAMIRESEDGSPAMAWLICDHATIRKYGLGYAKPAPVPVSTYLRNGYLQSGATIAELASTIGLDPQALEETVRRYNEGAARGGPRIRPWQHCLQPLPGRPGPQAQPQCRTHWQRPLLRAQAADG
ncbi:FAD-binding protein [Pseudoroseomonas wenyumeiae]